MSIQFNDTSTYKGLVQFYEKDCEFDRGFVSGNTDRLKEFAADANVAFDDFLSIAFGPDGTWQLDDSNQTDYPIIRTNIVSGQRDYSFTTDGSSNLILDIYKVMVANSSGVYSEIYPVDQQTMNDNQTDVTSFYDGRNGSGTPIRYDKTANGFFLDPIPNYNYTNGLKVFVNREPSYFAHTDTTKKPGVPGNLHSWFYKKPALEYAKRKSLSNYNALFNDVERLRLDIVNTFRRRRRDESPALTANVEDTK